MTKEQETELELCIERLVEKYGPTAIMHKVAGACFQRELDERERGFHTSADRWGRAGSKLNSLSLGGL